MGRMCLGKGLSMKYLLSFIIGVMTSFIFLHQSYETGYDLMSSLSSAAALDRDIRFFTLNDSELRCSIAKYASSLSSELENTDINENYVYDAPGLQSLTKESISKVIELYKEHPEIEEYAVACEIKTNLY
jgi:hypothetical protein